MEERNQMDRWLLRSGNYFRDAWNLKFPADYRRFLQILGAPDRSMFAVGFSGATLVEEENRPSFYNWRKDSGAIKRALKWPLKGILFDVEKNDLWLDSWGHRPNQPEERQHLISKLVRERHP
ncbi:MAG: hypothetical protein R2911_11520 [Caldilineaceae bacterium]